LPKREGNQPVSVAREGQCHFKCLVESTGGAVDDQDWFTLPELGIFLDTEGR
jgi:hypothetical protein